MNPIPRANVSQSIAVVLRDLIGRGFLAAGEALNEGDLAKRLGVSRTPLREALCLLVAEKAVIQIPRRGFFVRELTQAEANEIYALRPLLEPTALELAGLPSQKAIKKLVDLNERLAAAETPAMAVDLDNAWHRALIQGCPNRTLLETLEAFVQRTRRYELLLFSEPANLDRAVQGHRAILAAVQSHDLVEACRELRTNLTSVELVVQELGGRNVTPP